MGAIKRIHCHSAFRHYDMFHRNTGSRYGNSVFNTTYNFNGGSICGGGFWGGMLGGLGMGLGAGIMNFLGGGMFGGGCFGGGFPMMNMFGGGFPMMNMFGGGMFGGGFPMSNWFGGNSALSNWFGLGGKDKSSDKSEKNNADSIPLDKLEDRVKAFEDEALKDTSNIDANKLAILKKDIDNYVLKDSVDTDRDNERLKKLKERVNKINATKPDKTTPASTAASPEAEPSTPKKSTSASATPAAPAATQTPAATQPLTVEPPKPVATSIDNYIEKVDGTEEYQPTKPLSDETIIALSEEQTKKVLRFATNKMNGLADPFIKGTIESVAKKPDGTLKSYVINCESNGDFQLKYKVTPQSNGKSKIECIKDTTGKYYTRQNGIEYDISDSGMLENRKKYALVISPKIYNSLSEEEKKNYKKVDPK